MKEMTGPGHSGLVWKRSRSMQLSKRLQCIADYVTEGKRTADIGCDHGWVAIYLAEKKRAPAVIAMDVGKGPLKRAREHIRARGLEEKIETRLSDGMAALKKGEVEAVVMAGMGGPLMIRILQEGRVITESLDELILSPQSEIAQVRRFLAAEGWEICREEMLTEDGKYYTIMKAIPGTARERTEADFRYGWRMIQEKNPVLYQFLRKEEQTRNNILENLLGKDSVACRQRIQQLRRDLAVIREAIDRIEKKSEVDTYEM